MADKALSFPIHTALINGQPVRFFEGQSATPDLPWHVLDDLYKSLGMSRRMRREFLHMTQERWKGELRTVATSDGLLTVAPHFMAQGAIAAMAERGHAPANTYDQYVKAGIAALAVITGDRSKEDQFRYLMMAARNGTDQQPGGGVP